MAEAYRRAGNRGWRGPGDPAGRAAAVCRPRSTWSLRPASSTERATPSPCRRPSRSRPRTWWRRTRPRSRRRRPATSAVPDRALRHGRGGGRGRGERRRRRRLDARGRHLRLHRGGRRWPRAPSTTSRSPPSTDGNRSSDALAVDVVQDCAGPRVASASLSTSAGGDVVSIAFDEAVDAACLTVTTGGRVRLTSLRPGRWLAPLP